MLLTDEELREPRQVDKAREALGNLDRWTWQHEASHAVTATLVGARHFQRTWYAGDVVGTAWQRGVVAAAGPAWDKLTG